MPNDVLTTEEMIAYLDQVRPGDSIAPWVGPLLESHKVALCLGEGDPLSVDVARSLADLLRREASVEPRTRVQG